jgi:hypothetical protein
MTTEKERFKMKCFGIEHNISVDQSVATRESGDIEIATYWKSDCLLVARRRVEIICSEDTHD